MSNKISSKDIVLELVLPTGEKHLIESFADMVEVKGVGFIYGLEQGKEESDIDFAIRVVAARAYSSLKYERK